MHDFINHNLFQISEEEFENIKTSSDFSPVYRVLITDYSASHFSDVKSSQILGKIEHFSY